MAEKKRKRARVKLDREFWERYAETDRKLLERIAYYEKKIAEERAAREAASEDAA